MQMWTMPGKVTISDAGIEVKPTTTKARPFSVFVPLGTDQAYSEDPLKRLREWRDQDLKRRREWILAMVRACAEIGAAEIIWGAPHGVPEGSYVPAGQMERLRVEDIERFDDIRAANELAKQLGIARRTVFEGIGRKASTLRRVLSYFGLAPKWVYPRFSNYNERLRFDQAMRSASVAGCNCAAIDSMAALHDTTKEAALWAVEASYSSMELIGEGYMPKAGGIGWMLWAWQILQTGLAPRRSRLWRDLCVISGHTVGVTDPVSAVRLGREMEGRGWWCVYSCHSVEWVKGVGEALGMRH